jgi:hypothetical protein
MGDRLDTTLTLSLGMAAPNASDTGCVSAFNRFEAHTRRASPVCRARRPKDRCSVRRSRKINGASSRSADRA